jgi:predicted nucleotidyltransferase
MAKREKVGLSHLTPVEAEAIRAFVDRVNTHLPGVATRFILFGSKARRESHVGSDIDILVLVRGDDWRTNNAISTLAARISLEHDVLLGPVIIDQERWERMGREKFSLYRNATREGVVIPLSA